MKNILLLLDLILLVSLSIAHADPCDGEIFSLGCKMFEVIKKNTDTKTKELDKRFDEISNLHTNDSAETRILVDEIAQSVAKKHDDDMTLVSEITEKNMKVLERQLVNKINQSCKGRNETFVKLSGEITKSKKILTQQIERNNDFCIKGRKDLERKIWKSLNKSEDTLERKFMEIRKYVDKRSMTLETKVDHVIDNQVAMMKRVDQNTVGYKKGVHDVTRDLKALENTSRHDMKIEIAHVERKIDERYASLKAEVSKAVTKAAEDLEKSIEMKFNTKYEKMEQDVNKKISKVESDVEKIIDSDIDRKYDKLKREVSDDIMASIRGQFDEIKQSIEDVRRTVKDKQWPDGYYCVTKVSWKDCPDGFREKSDHYRDRYRTLCCKYKYE